MIIRKLLVSALAALSLGTTLFAQQTATLHLKRRVSDPLSDTSTLVDEFLEGSRLVSIAGPKTVIVDYSAATITIIDRERGTVATGTFEEFAAGHPAPRAAAKNREDEWRRGASNAVTHAGRSAERVELVPQDRSGDITKVTLTFDSNIVLGADALGALTGSRYPGTPDPSARAIAAGARRNRATEKAAESFALPLKIEITYDVMGEQFTVTNEVLAVDNDVPSPRLLEIPTGAQRVEPPFVVLKRELDAADQAKGH